MIVDWDYFSSPFSSLSKEVVPMKYAKELARFYQNKKTLLGISTEKSTAIYQRNNHYTIESDVILFSFSGFQKQLYPYRH